MVKKIHSDITIKKEEVFKKLKLRAGTSAFERAESIFAELEKVAFDIGEITSVYVVKENSYKLNCNELDTCNKLIFCYVSMGNGIVLKIKEFIDKGEFLDGYLLNYISDDMLFKVSSKMHRDIEEYVNDLKLGITKRYSPGDGDFPIENQKLILNEINEEIKVDAVLTSGYMIYPEKSMLFVYGADENCSFQGMDHDCSKCTKENCIYREL